MTISDKDFTGSIPEFYDTYLVPLIFEDAARDLASRVMAFDPACVLETAAGSGVVARELAPALGQDACYVVTDLNQPMLDHAAAKQQKDHRIGWQQADALDLPFDDHQFDVVICQFGVMFYPDRIRGYAEARRVLKPGARYIFSVWDEIATNEFADVVTGAAGRSFPDDPPRFLARTPHGYCDKSKIAADLEAAGFGNVTIEEVDGISRAPTARHPAVAYCKGTPLRNEIEARDAEKLDVVTDEAAEAIRARYGDGPVEAPIRSLVVTAEA